MNRNFPIDRGFTLLELLGVVAILGLLAGVIGTNLSGRGRIRLRQAEETIVNADQWIRQLAEQRNEPVRLRIQLNDHTLLTQTIGNPTSRIERRFDIPRSVEVRRAITAREDRTSGEVVVDYDREGSSLTYAIEIESDQGESKWIVLAGGTGQPLVFSESNKPTPTSPSHVYRETDVENLFRSLRKEWLHTD